MAKYTVQMTFETPGQQDALKFTLRRPGQIGSLQFLGGGGSLAVSASGVSADSPADAAMIVVKAANDRWHKRRGPLTMRSWTAHRERVLFGRRSSSGWTGTWDSDEGDEGGSAGVREPRRPLPGPGSLHAELELPGPEF